MYVSLGNPIATKFYTYFALKHLKSLTKTDFIVRWLHIEQYGVPTLSNKFQIFEISYLQPQILVILVKSILQM